MTVFNLFFPTKAVMVYPFKVSIFGTTKELEDDLLNPDEDETIIEIIESKIKK